MPDNLPVNTSPEETQKRVLEKMLKKTESEMARAGKALERLKIEYVDVEFLKPNAYNPNRQSEKDFELLCLSMETDGFTQPILAITNGVIIDGEHRWRAAKHLGYKKVPVVFTDMSAEQMRISTLRHNRARGSEDAELTSALLRDLEKLGAKDFAKESLLLSDEDMEFFIGDTSAPTTLAGESFGQAWEPVGLQDAADEVDAKIGGGLGFVVQANSGLPMTKAYSEKAATSLLELDKKIQDAKTDDERIALRRQHEVYRVVLSFTDDEGHMVAAVLGKKPSEKMYALCLEEYNAMKERGELKEDSDV